MQATRRSATVCAGTTALILLALATTGSVLLTGCGGSVSAEIQALRSRFLATAPPDGAAAISAIRAKRKKGELTADDRIVVRCRINAGDMPPWETGAASFVVTDATGHNGDKEHNPHTCPFCSRDIINSIARVQFHDPQGVVIATDARELFDLRENQLVVLSGTGQFDDTDHLVIVADQMFVKR